MTAHSKESENMTAEVIGIRTHTHTHAHAPTHPTQRARDRLILEK